MMTIEAFILTGGRSSRMGRDKSTLVLDGVTLAERALSIARATDLFSRVRTVTEASAVSATRDSITDVYKDRGPLAGLHAALNAADAEWVFLLGCDLPFVTTSLIARLLSFRSDACDAVVSTQSDGRVQPLCSFYRVDNCLTAAANLLEADSRAALKDLLANVRSETIAFDAVADLPGSEHFFLNINTPEDLETARRICGLTPVVAK